MTNRNTIARYEIQDGDNAHSVFIDLSREIRLNDVIKSYCY